jgi:streptogramin lyase
MKIWFTIISLLILAVNTMAQQNRFFFRKLTVADGLNDGNILAVSQDNQGFMWFSTRTGLNRFDGFSVKSYSHIAGDSTSIPTSLARAMSPDSSGAFLVGLNDGMLEYNAAADRFTSIKSLNGLWILQIIPIDKTTVFISTRSGLVKYNPVTKSAAFYKDLANSLFKIPVHDMVRDKNRLIIASGKGILEFNITTEEIKKLPIPVIDNISVDKIAFDDQQNLWVFANGKEALLKIAFDLQRYEVFDQYIESSNHTVTNFTDMISDQHGRIWVTTQLDGLLLYNDQTNKLERFRHDPLNSWTPSTNLHTDAFCDKNGTIWLGGNNGINYFNPDKNLFQIIPSFNKDIDTRNRRVARVAVEDKNGKLWFGTIDGLVKYDPLTVEYREFNNREGKPLVIHFNSVRGLLCDDDNNIWIATGHGINKYVQQENKMIFYSLKDSIPEAFYFSADKDHHGNFWFSCRDGDGFYYYNTQEKKFHSIRSFPALNVFAGYGGRKLFHDSKGRYWLGFNGEGLGMYDPTTNKHYHFRATSPNHMAIAGDAIVDILEDQKGFIWVSTFNGLSSINPLDFSIQNYNHTNGLINNGVSALAVDNQNRLWIGTGAGLMLLDSSRQYFTTFRLEQGLPSIEFPEHAASVLPSSDIMMPTQNGFIRFMPDQYKAIDKILTPYFTQFSFSGNKKALFAGEKMHLKANENFFTIGFGAINLNNATENWYAYKLEGLDDDWKYTQNRFVDYTNIPGGNYTFRIKASSNREVWQGPEQSFDLLIQTVFYKTWLFRIALIVIALALGYGTYRYRIFQQRQLLQLQGKAQLLEKEKAMVMFESLKQQLNPHFLFNSLTSLSGLIETDQKLANNFLEKMSKIYRYILKNRDSELVSLKEELNFVQVYISLQKTRFKDGLQVLIHVDEDFMHKKIAPVTLQNLVENAIKHNIIDLEIPLIIEISSDESYLVVQNNLQKKNMVETSNRQGLESMKSLYKYLNSQPLFIEETATHFIVRIPLI